MNKLVWGIKQLVPCMYRTVYRKEGKTYSCTWRMWLGRCFAIEEYEINYQGA